MASTVAMLTQQIAVQAGGGGGGSGSGTATVVLQQPPTTAQQQAQPPLAAQQQQQQASTSNVTGERCWCCWQWPSMSGCQTLKGTPAVVAAAYTRAERPLDAACRAPGAAAGAQEEEEGKGQGGWRPCLSMPGFWGRLMLWGCRSLGLEAELNNPTIWSALPATAGCALGRGRRGQRVHEQEEVQK